MTGEVPYCAEYDGCDEQRCCYPGEELCRHVDGPPETRAHRRCPPMSQGLTRAEVEHIRQRHKDFAERYSPGPDWEPFNQTHRDRGALLAALLAAWDALEVLINSSEAYMRYHEDKFYADCQMRPTGVRPVIDAARAALPPSSQ